MKPIQLLAVLTLIAGFAGCVSAQATLLTPVRYAPVPERDVHLYLNVAEVPAECVRIALIHAQANVDLTDEGQMIDASRRRAARVGGNALVLEEVRDPGTGTRVAAEVFGLPAERKGRMVAFRCPHLEPVTASG